LKTKQYALILALAVALAPSLWAYAGKKATSQPAKRPASRPVVKHGKHGKHNPPIDCPLRKAGINPHGLKPFKDVQKYIQMLERPDRKIWQKPDAVVKALGLKGNETVADIGSGSGYFTFRIAKQLPRGKVFAIDVEAEMIRHIHHNTMMKGIKNIHVVFAEKDDPKVPGGVDLVFVCDVLHHVGKRKLWLRRLFQSLKKGAKVVIIEFKAGKLPKGPPESLKIPKKALVTMFTKSGFKFAGEKPKLLPYQEFLIFQKP
jgi:SAM-dependent methyltransferase